MSRTETWNQRYNSPEYIHGVKPVKFLEHNIRLLPKPKALDLAMGEGRNAVYLASQGFDVTGVDISETAIEKCQRLARDFRVSVHTVLADLELYRIDIGKYNAIINTYYLQRNLIPEIKKGLKIGGVVLFETYTTDHLKYNPGLNPEFLLQPGELLQLFKDFKVLVYREGTIFDPEKGNHRAVASLIARRLI